jgi:hypothetical protein
MLRSSLGAIPKTMAGAIIGMSREEVFEALDQAIRDAIDQTNDAYEQFEADWNSKESDAPDGLKKIAT